MGPIGWKNCACEQIAEQEGTTRKSEAVGQALRPSTGIGSHHDPVEVQLLEQRVRFGDQLVETGFFPPIVETKHREGTSTKLRALCLSSAKVESTPPE